VEDVEYPYSVFRKDGKALFPNGRFATREEAEACGANIKKCHGDSANVVIEGPPAGEEEDVAPKKGGKKKDLIEEPENG
jgi:hypothetical protein